MKPWVHRLPVWSPTDRPWLVICAGSVGWFHTWPEAYEHAIRIAP